MAVITRKTSFVVSDCTGAPAQGRVELFYDTSKPLQVLLLFTDDIDSREWVISRDVLARRATGYGDCICDTDGIWTVLHLTGDRNAAADVKILTSQVDAFLAATTRAVPYGAEKLDFDAELDALLKDGAR